MRWAGRVPPAAQPDPILSWDAWRIRGEVRTGGGARSGDGEGSILSVKGESVAADRIGKLCWKRSYAEESSLAEGERESPVAGGP